MPLRKSCYCYCEIRLMSADVEKFLEDVSSNYDLPEELAKTVEAENDHEEVTKMANFNAKLLDLLRYY